MEVVPKESLREENMVDFNGVADENKDHGKVGNGKSVEENDNSNPSSPSQREPSIIKQEDQLESTKAEMGEVREENERLKTMLSKIVEDYQTLQCQFYNIVQQGKTKKTSETTSDDQEIEESELVSLSLGTITSGLRKEEKIGGASKAKEEEQSEEGLTLGLDCKFEVSTRGPTNPRSNLSPENSFEDPKEEVGEAWPPSKILKTLRSGDDEVSQQTLVKKARVSVRARCDTPTMNDGCQWRKYGQKISKGNPCPRAYYRCTIVPGCPVKKQVQRCVDDMSILITTYEGNHNHPLSVSATAMASTTTAAACMLMSGSSTSQQNNGSLTSTTTSADLHGLNFSFSDNTRSRQFYLHNPSISPSPSYPTITLDLTSAQSSQFNRFSTSFNFSSSESNTIPTSWDNGYLSYGSHLYKQNQIADQSYLQKNNAAYPQQSLTETVAAATKAVTSDPTFRSALAAAITSIVSGGGVNQGTGETISQNVKLVEPLQAVNPSSSSSSNGNGFALSYLSRSSSSNHQQGNFMFLSSSLPFSSSKSTSASPVGTREQIN